MVKLLLIPNSELSAYLAVDSFIIAGMSGLHLRRVPALVWTCFRCISA